MVDTGFATMSPIYLIARIAHLLADQLVIRKSLASCIFEFAFRNHVFYGFKNLMCSPDAPVHVPYNALLMNPARPQSPAGSAKFTK